MSDNVHEMRRFVEYELKVLEAYAKLLRKRHVPKLSKPESEKRAFGVVFDSPIVKKWYREAAAPGFVAEMLWSERH